MGQQAVKDLPVWWKDAVVYQIYPATFNDTTGSGLGDLQGVIEKLEYIASLGVNTIWISPFFKSPQKDLGYDISDYTAVHEPYGQVKDVETIIRESKKLGMKVLADLVVNHCSDQHEWFKEARKSKTNPKRDWFIWRPAKVGPNGERKEPNNWRCSFGGPTWTWHEETQEYYYHGFLPEQPELNWENEDCRQAIYRDAIKFWLDRGLAGFRVDTANQYSKPSDFPDAPITNPDTPYQSPSQFTHNGPRIHEYLREMRKEAWGDVVTIGELGACPDYKDVLKYIGTDVKEMDMVIQFEVASLTRRGWALMATPWKLSELKHHTFEAQRLADPANKAWACTYIANHDVGRAVSRFGSDLPEHRVASAKMLATYQLTLSGTPIVYQGDEIGMINIGADRPIEEYIDCDSTGFLEEAREVARKKGDEGVVEKAIEGIRLNARDSARTPFQWDNTKNAGFSTAEKCWMRANDSYKEGLNVAEQEKDPKSVLAYYRKLIELRKANAGIFTHGKYVPEENEKDDENVFIYTKECRDTGKKAVVVLNWSKSNQSYKLPAGAAGLKVALDSGDAGAEGELTPYAAKIYM